MKLLYPCLLRRTRGQRAAMVVVGGALTATVLLAPLGIPILLLGLRRHLIAPCPEARRAAQAKPSPLDLRPGVMLTPEQLALGRCANTACPATARDGPLRVVVWGMDARGTGIARAFCGKCLARARSEVKP